MDAATAIEQMMDAATAIGQMISKILKLAPEAGLVVEIKVKPAPSPPPLVLVEAPCAPDKEP